jgi:hypothetical protein
MEIFDDVETVHKMEIFDEKEICDSMYAIFVDIVCIPYFIKGKFFKLCPNVETREDVEPKCFHDSRTRPFDKP